MLTIVIGAVFCSAPLAVLFERFVPPRRLPQQWAANDNFTRRERLPNGRARANWRAPACAAFS
jgi:hypothetical protein